MNIEEFYSVIRRDTDPVDFSTLKQETTGLYYSESEDKVVDNGTAYYLRLFLELELGRIFCSRCIFILQKSLSLVGRLFSVNVFICCWV